MVTIVDRSLRVEVVNVPGSVKELKQLWNGVEN